MSVESINRRQQPAADVKGWNRHLQIVTRRHTPTIFYFADMERHRLSQVERLEPRRLLATVSDSLINSPSFEDDLGSWFVIGSRTELSQTTDAFTGDHAGLAARRTRSADGFAYDLLPLLRDHATYEVSLQTRLGSSALNPNVKAALYLEDATGTHELSIGSIAAETGQWTELIGGFFYQPTGRVHAAELRIHGPNAGVHLLIDDVIVTTGGVQADSVSGDGTFDNSLGEFVGLGASISLDAAAERSGGSSVKTNGRTENWQGLFTNLKDDLVIDQDYQLSAWVKLDGVGEEEAVNLKLYQRDGRGRRYLTLDSETATSAGWTLLEAGFRLGVNGRLNQVELIIDGPGAGVDFFVEDVRVTPYDWQTEADEMIEEYRKSDAMVEFVDENGVAAPLLDVQITQVGNEFGFGSTLHIDANTNDTYRQYFTDVFGFEWATTEYALQWTNTEFIRDVEDGYAVVDGLVQFIEDNGLKSRGHSVFWGNLPNVGYPAWLDSIPDMELQDEVLERIQSVVSRYEDVFEHWDVINEVLDHPYLERRIGADINDWVFQQVHELDSDATLFANEYHTATHDQSNLKPYRDLVRGYLDAGIPLGGIGVQGHFKESISPWAIRTRLAQLAQFGIPMWFTEFDTVNPEVTERAKDLEAFYRTAFSMPTVDGTIMWGFWDGNHWLDDAALLDQDWTINEMGQTYLDLMDEWTTRVTGTVDADGQYAFRGFQGEYEIVATRPDGSTLNATFDVVPGENPPVQIVIPGGNGLVPRAVGGLGRGVAARDAATGLGYLMFSQQSIHTRFADAPPFAANADHFVAVVEQNGRWFYDTNGRLEPLVPAASDTLVATIDFDADVVTPTEGQQDIVGGIRLGYHSGDLSFTAECFANRLEPGEFCVSGAQFNAWPDLVPAIPVGDLGALIAATDANTGTGFMLYSQEAISTRFADIGTFARNADHFIPVVYDVDNEQWLVDNNQGLHPFATEPTDILVAEIDFDDDTIATLDGQDSIFQGVQRGYSDGDLMFFANQTNRGGGAGGEFGVVGSFFRPHESASPLLAGGGGTKERLVAALQTQMTFESTSSLTQPLNQPFVSETAIALAAYSTPWSRIKFDRSDADCASAIRCALPFRSYERPRYLFR